jgi:hypothetical protein|tara:strand:- start:616 stop:1473 length:858 start_codon:yes stop_codon:yes gene_type:complete
MRIEDFYKFMKEREIIRLRKEDGEPYPWTTDPIFQTYKFTNVKRADDKTTRWFWKNVLEQNADKPKEQLLFHCALFRYFGTTEFAEAYGGWLDSWLDDKETVRSIAKKRLKNSQRVFTGAYVITNQGIKAPKQDVVIDQFLTPLWHKLPDLVQVAEKTHSWQAVALEMMKLKGFGGTGFMTKEVLQDALHTSVFERCVDRNTWCPVGPGAKRGINRVLGNLHTAPLRFEKGLQVMKELFAARKTYWSGNYIELELHDIQFQLCEFDKYERVKHNEGRPRSKYHVK